MSVLLRPIARRRFLQVLGGAAAGGAVLLGAPLPFGRLLGRREVFALASSLFPMDESVAATVLAAARSRGAGFSEIYLERRVVTRLRLSDEQIDSVEQGIFAGCGIRAVDEDRTGYAFADSYQEKPLLAAARDAAAIAERGSLPQSPMVFRSATPPATIRVERPVEDASFEERVGWLQQADQAARTYHPTVKQVTIDYADETLRVGIVNSDGLWTEDTIPLVSVFINVVAVRNGARSAGMMRLSHRQGVEQVTAGQAAETAREAARQAVAMLDAGEAPSGEMPVVLASGGGVLFHEAVGHGLEGDFVRKKTSFYTGKVGQKVASERVSVIDTGGIPGLRGSYNMDDEGTVPAQSVLIAQGELQGFMTDRITAAILQVARTGNGRRESYRYPPLVRMSNTYLPAGEDSVEEMIAEVRSGIFARMLGGGEVDTTTGNFTFGLREAYRIEQGKIGPPVRGAVLVGNGPEIMKRIDRVGPDLKFWNGSCGKGQSVPVTCGAPTLRISSMTVGGSQQG